MKILVTGGAGFIGSNLVDKLIENGHDVVVVDDLSRGKREQVNSKANFYEVDIQSPKLAEIFTKENPQAVFHLAAQIDIRKSVEDPVNDAKINILGGINVINESQKVKVNKFIFSSTGGAIYGDADIVPTPEDYPAWPNSPYGIAKLSIEHYLYYFGKELNLPYTVLRYANVYGPRQDPHGEAGVVAIFTKKLLENERPTIFGDGEQTRDYVFVGDVVNANLLALESKTNDTYNIGTGVKTSVNEIFASLKNITKSNLDPIYAPGKLGEQKVSCLSFNKIKHALNWEPTVPFKKGMEITVDYFRK